MKLLFKRILAGTIDFLLIAMMGFATFLLFKKSYDTAFIVTLFWIAKQHSTTPGGILLGLKISPMNSEKRLMIFLRIFLLAVPLVVLIKTSASMQTIFWLIFINILPALFTEKRLMLHDLISRSFVENDDRNKFTKKNKVLLWLGFVSAIILLFAAMTTFYFSKTGECENLYKEQQFQKVIDECAFAKSSPDINLLVGKSYMSLKNYDEAMKHLTAAEAEGSNIATLNISLLYASKDDFDNALKVSEKVQNRNHKLFLRSHIHLLKFKKLQNADDLIKAVAYFKLISPVSDDAGLEAVSDKIEKYEKGLYAEADQVLSQEQKATIESVKQQLQSTELK